MERETGGPAFPYSGVHKGDDAIHIIDSHGMTLRDYMAAKAMQGMISSFVMMDNVTNSSVAWAASGAYRMADAMLKARAK
ncbi:UNVERIFIED_ORG: hypothetical protein J2Y78_003809 [Buttiauxella agrestis ATCC 33320]